MVSAVKSLLAIAVIASVACSGEFQNITDKNIKNMYMEYKR